MRQPQLVHKIQQTLNQGGARLFEILPAQLRNVLKQKLWLDCTDKNGKSFTSFEAFVVHRLPQGLESRIDDLLNFCRKAEDVQALIRAAIQPVGDVGGTGANQYTKAKAESGQSNICNTKSAQEKPKRQANAAYIIGRLKKEGETKLAEQVIAGKVSAHTAAVQTGIRHERIAVRVDTPENALRPLVKKFGIPKLQKALDSLSKE